LVYAASEEQARWIGERVRIPVKLAHLSRRLKVDLRR
jgi:hypothetical protein